MAHYRRFIRAIAMVSAASAGACRPRTQASPPSSSSSTSTQIAWTRGSSAGGSGAAAATTATTTTTALDDSPTTTAGRSADAPAAARRPARADGCPVGPPVRGVACDARVARLCRYDSPDEPDSPLECVCSAAAGPSGATNWSCTRRTFVGVGPLPPPELPAA